MNLRSGTRLGPYEIVGLIGAGGMGEVYRAQDTRLGRSVAVKILPSEFTHDIRLRARFEREAKLISSLNHPHICTLHDVGRENELDYLVMELCEGKTLAQRLLDGPLAIAQVLDYGIQIADALEKAHRKGIIHRDLKPSNIMITKAGVKLLDFGLAKQQETQEIAGSYTVTLNKSVSDETGIAGTLQYMPPETLTGGRVDARSDIYALGLVVYEMIGARPAFRADSRAELVLAILEHEPPPLTTHHQAVDPLLLHIVSRCLKKDPDQRWQSAGDVAVQLQWLRTRPETNVRASRKPGRFLWVIMAAAVATVLMALTIALTRTSTAKPISHQRLTFRRGIVTHARFAPDGQTIVFGASWDGEPARIFVKRPEGDAIVPLDLPAADLMSVSRSGELAILIDPRRELPWTLVGTLARVSLAGGSPRRLVDGVISADWSPDGRSLALVRDDGRTQRLELRTHEGELTRQLFATSSGGLSHVRFSPSGDRIAFVSHPNRSSTNISTVMVMKQDGSDRRSLGSTNVFTAVTWSPYGDEIWFAETRAHLQSALRAVSLSGRIRTITNSPGSTSFHDAAGAKILMTQNDIGARVSCVARGSTAERDASWGAWALPIQMTADGRQLLILGSSPTPNLVALKPLDGSPQTNLTSGFPYSFSADERSVLIAPDQRAHPADLAFVPIDRGGRMTLPPTNLDAIAGAVAAPNGKTVILAGVTNNVTRLYEKRIDGGELRLISNDPIYFPFIAVSSDSSRVAAVGPTRRLTIYDVANGQASVIPASIPGDLPIRFADDGSVLYSRYLRLPSIIYRYDSRTQRESVVREIAPADRAGLLYAYPKAMTADAQSYCYQYTQVLSKLYLTEGIDWQSRGFW